MFTSFTPFAISNNVYDIDVSFFTRNKIKYILCDLDNTLDAYYNETPSKEAIEFKNKLDKVGIKLIVISNNTKKRVEKYASSLGTEFIYNTRKPLTFKLKKYIKVKEIDKNNAIIIGDQVFTDVLFGNRLGIKTILCDNLVPKDQFFTKINKFFDKYVRIYLKNKGKLISWRDK